jgi:hypothetical protein
LNAGYADAAPDGGLDASERDALFDVLGLHFTETPVASLRRHGSYPAVLGRPPAWNDRRRLEGQFLRRDRIAGSPGRYAKSSWSQRCGEHWCYSFWSSSWDANIGVQTS